MDLIKSNGYQIKRYEEEDIEKQKIVFIEYSLAKNFEYLVEHGFIEAEKGITNKGIKALMQMDLIQYSQDFNKEAKKWIALLDKE